MTNYNRLASYIVRANAREEKKKAMSRIFNRTTLGGSYRTETRKNTSIEKK